MNNFIYTHKSTLLRIKRFLNAMLKFDVVKYPTPELDRRIKFLKNNAVTVVLDVGANIGQYGSELRSIGYEGQIISFEPTNDAYKKLVALSKKDKKWETFHYSLGEFDGESEINISKNSVSSSLLNNLPQLIESAPSAAIVAIEKISVKKLDTIFNDLLTDSDTVYLKIDTQGYENMVLNGGLNSLKKIKLIQVEMALIPTYEDSLSFEQMIEKLTALRFKLISIESGYYDKKTGNLLEVDGVFINEYLA